MDERKIPGIPGLIIKDLERDNLRDHLLSMTGDERQEFLKRLVIATNRIRITNKEIATEEVKQRRSRQRGS